VGKSETGESETEGNASLPQGGWTPLPISPHNPPSLLYPPFSSYVILHPSYSISNISCTYRFPLMLRFDSSLPLLSSPLPLLPLLTSSSALPLLPPRTSSFNPIAPIFPLILWFYSSFSLPPLIILSPFFLFSLNFFCLHRSIPPTTTFPFLLRLLFHLSFALDSSTPSPLSPSFSTYTSIVAESVCANIFANHSSITSIKYHQLKATRRNQHHNCRQINMQRERERERGRDRKIQGEGSRGNTLVKD